MTKGGKQVPQVDFSSLGPLSNRFSINAPTETESLAGYRVVSAAEVCANPRNPREELGDLDELIAILEAEGQLQACVAMTRAAYLKAYPNDAGTIGQAKYVIIAGSRRLTAIQTSAVLNDIKIEIHDELADDPQKLQRAALSENINRKNFKPLEEARAIRDFVDSMDGIKGAQRQAATLLNRTPAWVSQRLALLKLVPEIQAMVDTEALPVKVARKIGTKPEDEQMAALAAWREQGQSARPGPADDSVAVAPEQEADEPGGGAAALAHTPQAAPGPEPTDAAPPPTTDHAKEAETAPPAAPMPHQRELPTGEPVVDDASVGRDSPVRPLEAVSLNASVQQIAAQLRERLDEHERRELAELLLAADHQLAASA